ncbi:MAG TPA: malto-oligosyltrehalose synthase, partial [Thermoanaerobaculia bacterium]|nr:malto-oligosyltrehalose synthase [Thermoanaerobaculia bacterium]
MPLRNPRPTQHRARIPSSTYRIQFNAEFGFSDAVDITPYLSRLGIGDIYASPSLTARSGSTHGYDVADPSRVSRELGGARGFTELSNVLRSHDMGLLLDIVPNHMAASTDNPWWTDLLENGRSSRYARYFDIDWDPTTGKGTLSDKILLPVLGQVYGAVLESGEIRIELDEDGIAVRYYELKIPVSPRSWLRILGDELAGMARVSDTSRAIYDELNDLTAGHEDGDLAQGDFHTRRRRIWDKLWTLYTTRDAFRQRLDARLATLNGTPGNPGSFDELDSILEEQVYRLAYWRRAADEINYRRFFDITDLVGVRVEEEEVFRERHVLIMALIREGLVTGLRIDHIDGLLDPARYLERLQQSAVPGWKGDPARPGFYVVVEKILGQEEHLREDFATHGSSGYDYLAAVNLVFVDPAGLETLGRNYRRLTGVGDFDELVYEKKKQVLDDLFWGDVRRLGDELISMARVDRHARDVRARQISKALVEITAFLRVYRTYTRDYTISAEDRHYIEEAVGRASQVPMLSPRAIEFVRSVLLLEMPAYAEDRREEWLGFLMRWQQFTGPVMAKGVEDTSFYIYNRLISMNEVGGEPSSDVSRAVDQFHEFNAERAERWPHALNGTSTHDTKRSEDVRARINVISELAGAWNSAVLRWMRMNEKKKRAVRGRPVPHPNEEILIYQTLAGAWPLDKRDVSGLPERLEQFLIKAAREAKLHTTWLRPDDEYEEALTGFARRLLRRSKDGFLDDFLRLQEKISYYGFLNSISQVALKATSPGVPDFYRGTEIWDLSLVDPDNRRPVDYD